ASVGERLFGLPPLIDAQRAMGHKCRDTQLPKFGPQSLRARAAVDENQALLTPPDARDDDSRMMQRANRPTAQGSPRWPTGQLSESHGLLVWSLARESRASANLDHPPQTHGFHRRSPRAHSEADSENRRWEKPASLRGTQELLVDSRVDRAGFSCDRPCRRPRATRLHSG